MKKFKKGLIGVMLVTGIVAVGCTAIGKKIEQALAIQPNYYTQTQTNYPIERQYTGMGQYAVQSQVFPSNDARFKSYKVWYPANIAQSTKPFPVIVSANGTGFPYQKYEPVLTRLASWGFVVIGNDDGTSWSGLSSSQSLAKLGELNTDKNSVFYGKLNINNSGIVGHSQGGFGVVNAITVQPHHEKFKSAVILSSNAQSNSFLKWTADATQIRVPTLILSSTGKADETLAPLVSIQKLYSQIPNNVHKVMALRQNADHGDMLYRGDGYMTAWFLYTLLNDANAGKAFVGANPEIKHNGLWQDVQIKP